MTPARSTFAPPHLAPMSAAAMLALTLGACDSGDAPPNPPPPDDFAAIASRSWTIPPGEYYKCTRVRLDRDVVVSAFRSLAPQGTHHAVLTVASLANGPLGDYDCEAGSLDYRMIYASGVGTPDYAFPEGIGIRIPSGYYLNLNLHLFNLTEGDMSGESGVLIKEIDEADLTDEAEMVFGGTQNITIPSGGATHSASGGCEMDAPATLLSLWPHMHQLGTASRTVLTRDNVPQTLFDEPYSFAEQTFYEPQAPVELLAGDQLMVTCDYVNNTGDTVYFGDSSTQEMCFTGMIRYPKRANSDLFDCVDKL